MNTPVPDLPLKDIHLPDAISWWPLAIGWWLLLGSVLCLIAFVYLIVRYNKKPCLKKTAIIELTRIQSAFEQSENSVQCVSDLSLMLRKIVISKKDFPKNLAGLTGISWLQFLDKKLEEPEFSLGPGQILLSGPYQRQIGKEDAVQLIKLCRKWVDKL